jgi:SAM-dependent methyltransferase
LIDKNKYIGLELSKKAQLMASQVGDNVYVQTIEEHAVNTRQKYDVVCSFQVLEHVENPESFISSCISCLKPGGLLIISVPSEDSFLRIVEDGILNMPPHHITRWTDKTLMWLADKFNLEIIALEHEQLDDIHVHGYATELIRSVIKSIFHLKAEVISTALSHRFLTLICQILGKYYSQILSNPYLRPVGQSVTMVSRKAPRE